jgi:type IV pilus assembly protein PilW
LNPIACHAPVSAALCWPRAPVEESINMACNTRRGGRAAGFSLVEVMVALVIGMLGIVVMMQMFSMFEGQKRTTTGGDDAINSGSLSLYGLQRDLQQAGWGTSAINIIGCNVSGLVAGGASIPFAPVTINPAGIPAGDTNTDTLLVVAGNGNGTVEGDVILSGAGTSYSVHTPTAFLLNDFVVAARQTRTAGACTLNATTIASVTSSTVTVSAAAASFTVAASDRLFLLGANPVVRVYAIRNGSLTLCDWRVNDCGAAGNLGNAAIWTPLASNLVSLRAQYGRDTATAGMDGVLDVWSRTIPTTAAPISTNAAKNMEACALARTLAVRVVLVARSSQPEKRLDGDLTGTAYVTPGAPLWAGNDSVAVAIDSAEAGNVAINLSQSIFPVPTSWPMWQDFRYKVFQTIVPLRNITNQGVLEEC